MNLEGIRLAVRTQLDLDETDLPDLLLDLYVQEGYDRMIDMEARWPFFEWPGTISCPPVRLRRQSRPTLAMIELIIGAPGHCCDHIDLRRRRRMFRDPRRVTGTPSLWTQIGIDL